MNGKRSGFSCSLLSLVLGILTASSILLIVENWSPWCVVSVLEGHAEGVLSVEFSSDGELVLTSNEDGTTRVWNARSGAEIDRLDDAPRSVHSACFSEDGRKVLIAAGRGGVRLWDRTTGQSLAMQSTLPIDAWDAAFSTDQSLAVTACADGVIRIYSVASPASGAELRGHTEPVDCISVSPDGQYIASCADDGSVRIWDLKSQKCVKVLEITAKELNLTKKAHLADVAYSPDGLRLVISPVTGAPLIWTPSTDQRAPIFHGLRHTLSSRFSPDGHRIVSVTNAECDAYVWDSRTGDQLALLRHSDGLTCAAFSPDGQHIITGGGVDGNAYIWCRRRPESWWGFACLPHLWLAVVLGLGCLLTLRAHRKAMKAVAARRAQGCGGSANQ